MTVTAVVNEPFQVQYVNFVGNNDVTSALQHDGLVAMTNVPGLAEARERALVATAECVLQHGGSVVAPVSLQMQDKSIRSSWGAFADEEMPNTEACPELQQAMQQLRTAVDAGSMRFAELLDNQVLYRGFDLGLMSRLDAESYSTFSEMLDAGKRLDHIHVYEKPNMSNEQRTLDMHTDQGLFIAIVPSLRVLHKEGGGVVDKKDESFVVEQSDGAISPVQLPEQGDVLLFMMGDGINYLTPRSHKPLRAVPHGLNQMTTSAARAWFGRMFLAPDDAVLVGTTAFHAMMEEVAESRRLNQAFPMLSCGGMQQQQQQRRVLHDTSGHNCTAGQAYCWMGCRSTTGLECDHPICQSSETGLVWEDCETCHDPTARLVCATGAPSASGGATLAPTTSAPSASAGATLAPTTSAAFQVRELSLAVMLAGFAAIMA